jgi:hypothetical protein
MFLYLLSVEVLRLIKGTDPGTLQVTHLYMKGVDGVCEAQKIKYSRLSKVWCGAPHDVRLHVRLGLFCGSTLSPSRL